MAKDLQRWRRHSSTLLLAAAVAVAGLWLTAIFWTAAQAAIPVDFTSFYCGAQILRTQGASALYDYEAMRQCDARQFPGHDIVLPFIRPPFYALLLLPLTAWPPRSALLVWLALNALALLAAVLFLPRVADVEPASAAWHTAIFFPSLFTFFNRQDLPLVLLAATVAYWLVVRGRRFESGLALSLCAIKFHLMLLVPLALAIRRDWRSLAGLATGGGALLLVSFLLVGTGGLADYGRLVVARGVPNIENNPERVANVSNLAGRGWARVPLAAAVLLAVAVAARRLPGRQALAAGWLGSLLIAPHIFVSDYLVALPACLLLAPLSRFCLLSSVLLLFPVTPILMLFQERLALSATVFALALLVGAATSRTPRANNARTDASGNQLH